MLQVFFIETVFFMFTTLKKKIMFTIVKKKKNILTNAPFVST